MIAVLLGWSCTLQWAYIYFSDIAQRNILIVSQSGLHGCCVVGCLDQGNIKFVFQTVLTY